jgi:hypothetical protein
VWEARLESASEDSRSQVDRDIAAFLDQPLQPFDTLNPRESVRGSFSEMVSPIFVKEEGTVCHAYDINGHYTNVAMSLAFPTGPYSRLRGHDLDASSIVIRDGQFFYMGKAVHGLAYCRVYAPLDLNLNGFPLLPQKIGKKTILALCHQCAKEKSDSDICSHSKKDRSFSSVYTIIELVKAFEVGYELEFYELLIFDDANHILRPFMSAVSFEKQRHSNKPSYLDEQEFCSRVNDFSFYSELGLQLQPANMASNAYKKKLFKQIANAALGHFAMNESKYTQTKFAQSRLEIVETFKTGKLVDLLQISPNICQMTLENTKTKENGISEGSRARNVVINAYITSKARLVMFEHVQGLLRAPKRFGIKLHLVSADAIYFSAKKSFDVSDYLPLGENPGQFSRVHKDKEVVEFAALAPKAYCSVLQDSKDSSYSHDIKVSGFQQVALMKNYRLAYSTIKQTLNDMLRNQLGKFQVQQIRKTGCKQSKRVKFVHKKQRYSFAYGNSRQFKQDQNGEIVLRPFGYNLMYE